MFDPDRLCALARGASPAAVCTVIETSGSTPRKVGASMVVIDDGTPVGAIEGTIGGGAVEHEVRRRALEVIARGQAEVVTVALSQQLGMCCGGTMRFFIEPLRLQPPVFIFGAGHVGAALAQMASAAGFDVTVADPRSELLVAERLGGARCVDDYAREDIDALPLSVDAFVVVATHDHQTDQRLVELLLDKPHRYLALVGSQRKALLTRERCINRGIDAERVATVVCPAGVDISAETPEEIAISICAQMVQVRRQRDRRVDAASASAPKRIAAT